MLLLKVLDWGQVPECVRIVCFVLTGFKANFRDF